MNNSNPFFPGLQQATGIKDADVFAHLLDALFAYFPLSARSSFLAASETALVASGLNLLPEADAEDAPTAEFDMTMTFVMMNESHPPVHRFAYSKKQDLLILVEGYPG